MAITIFFDHYSFALVGIVPVAFLWGLAWVVSGFRHDMATTRAGDSVVVDEGVASVESPTRRVRTADPQTSMGFFVRRHENGWAAVVLDMGEGDDPRRYLAGTVKVGSEPLYTTPITPCGVYQDLDDAKRASDQQLREEASHSRCSASCIEWVIEAAKPTSP